MPLNQIDVFGINEMPKENSIRHVDIFFPEPLIPISVNSKLESSEEAKKHMPGELEDSPI